MPVNLRQKKRSDGTSKGYYAEFYDRHRVPQRKWLSLGTGDKSVARQKLAEMEREWALKQFDPWNDQPKHVNATVQEGLDRFLADRTKHCAEGTVATYRDVLRPLMQSLGPSYPLYGVEARHIEAYLAKPRAEATRKSYTDRLGIFFRFCVEERMLDQNPMPLPPKAPGKRQRRKDAPEFLSEEQYVRLLGAIEADATTKALSHGNRWLIRAIRLAVGTGMRRGELANLRWGAVDLKRGLLHVRNEHGFTTKNGYERVVPIVGEARALLEELYAALPGAPPADRRVLTGGEGGPLAEQYLAKRFREYRVLAGLPGEFHFHSLRHTFASWWVQRGGDLYRLKEVMGHGDVRVTLQYAHLRPESLIQEAHRLFPHALRALPKMRAGLT